MSNINIKSIDASSSSLDTIKSFIGLIPEKKKFVTPKIEYKSYKEALITFEGNYVNQEITKLLDSSNGKTFYYLNFDYEAPEIKSETENALEYDIEKFELQDNKKTLSYEEFLSKNSILLENTIKPFYSFLKQQGDNQKSSNIQALPSLKDYYDKLYDGSKNVLDQEFNNIAEAKTQIRNIYFSAPAVSAFPQYAAREDNKPVDFFSYFNKLSIPIPSFGTRHYHPSFKNAYFKNIFTLISAGTVKNLQVSLNDTQESLRVIFDDNRTVKTVPFVFINNSYLPSVSDEFYPEFVANPLTNAEKQFKSKLEQSITGIYYGSKDINNPTFKINANISEVENKIEKIFKNQSISIEPLFVKIEKYIGSSATQIQQMFFSFDEETPQTLELIDNQIFLSKSYRYEVKIVCVLYGLEYTYTKHSSSENSITYKCNSKLKQIIVELPYFISEAPGFKNALSIPDPNIFVDRLKPNEIKVSFNTLNATTSPSPVTTADQDFFDTIVDKNNKITFDDEKIDFFQVYRTVQEPRVIKDFSSFLYVSVPKNNVFIDTIDFNKDYYYVFQSIRKNKFSNPSFIYKVRLNFSNGTFDPQISIYNLKEPSEVLSSFRKTQIPIKRFFKIEPSFYQKAVKEVGLPGTYQFSDVKLVGNQQTDFSPIREIWASDNSTQKFKVRITSKSTGRAVDIVLNFKYRTINKFK